MSTRAKTAIGDVELDNPIVLAPMAGVTDIIFRRICRRMGAGLVCGEMISAQGFVHNSSRTIEMMQTDKDEHPVSMQVFGAKDSSMAVTAETLVGRGADIVDINAGCPIPKIVRNGAGVALMKDIERFESIVKSVVNAAGVPVTVKLRSGWDADSINVCEVARIAEQCGAAAVTVHPRTRGQMFRGAADWSVIAEVVDAVGIPVFGSGDVRSPADARRMIEQTECAGVMIGRAALGNPWIFRRTVGYLLTGEDGGLPGLDEIVDVFVHHLKSAVSIYGEYRACKIMRKHAAWYVRNVPGSAEFRRRVCRATEMNDYLAAIDELKCRIANRRRPRAASV
ncbi:MAG: tRNA dihydrouridine synthase DusB [Candidatus Hydrogenedentes bacterium]|nr:tRNA dihydrouridine synthase DusB [Candidatus Hydrogenedentota bacterium]